MLSDPVKTDTVPDGIVWLRQFVGGINSALNDQTYAGTDGYVGNPSGGFLAVGPYGSSVEGQPISVSQAGGVTVSPSFTLILLGAAAFWLLTRGR